MDAVDRHMLYSSVKRKAHRGRQHGGRVGRRSLVNYNVKVYNIHDWPDSSSTRLVSTARMGRLFRKYVGGLFRRRRSRYLAPFIALWFVFVLIIALSGTSEHFVLEVLDSPTWRETITRAIDTPQQFHCDSDCLRFKQNLERWPAYKPKAAIYILTRGERIAKLSEIIRQLDDHFNKQFRYPLIIFHEGEFREHIETVRQLENVTADVYFQELHFKLPNFLSRPVEVEIANNAPVCRKSGIGYRHMCRFHAKTVYEHPIVKDLEYAWRLDDDSILPEPITYDVFDVMKKNDLWYGYTIRYWDNMFCVPGLWEATDRFVKEEQVEPTFYNEWPKPMMFYNNFEISSVAFWRSADYQTYINYIDQLGGIFYHRWGDAPIKSIAVALYMNKNRTHHFDDIIYQHGKLSNPPGLPGQYLFQSVPPPLLMLYQSIAKTFNLDGEPIITLPREEK